MQIGNSVKGLAATTRALRVRISNFEALSLQPVIEINARATQIGQARRIHQDLHSLGFKSLVVCLGQIERHAILEARAAAPFDENTELFLRVALRSLH